MGGLTDLGGPNKNPEHDLPWQQVCWDSGYYDSLTCYIGILDCFHRLILIGCYCAPGNKIAAHVTICEMTADCLGKKNNKENKTILSIKICQTETHGLNMHCWFPVSLAYIVE